MSELRGVMLVDASFSVYPEAATENEREMFVGLIASDDGVTLQWQARVGSGSANLVHARCDYLAECAAPIGEHPSPTAIDTAIAQAYDAFCLQYDLWRRASHIEWLPVLPMSLGVEPGQRSGTWKFSASPAPKATSPEGQQPSTGRKQKQHGKSRNNSTAGKASAGGGRKRG